MLEQMKVKKWGGENAAELVKSPKNVLDDFNLWIKQAIVVSAIRSPEFNTTDQLIKIGNLLSKEDLDQVAVNTLIKEIKDFHIEIIKQKLPWNNDKILNQLFNVFYKFTYDISDWINNKKIIPSKSNDYTINTQDGLLSIIWFWEMLSALIQEEVINNLWVDWLEAETLDFTWIASWLKWYLDESELFSTLSREISDRVMVILTKGNIPVVSWYIPWFKKWYENVIWRGYTDPTAAMTAVGLSDVFDVTLEIQKSVLWMLSADPRIVHSETKIIESLDYLTAKEITWARWAQAKLLHHHVLRKELQEAGINVRLFDPFSSSKWTLISKFKNKDVNWVEYVGWRKNVIFFSISSWKMSWTWILSKVFQVVKDYTPVDIIWTTETEISFTIDSWLSKEKLEQMSNDIRWILNIEEDWYENFVKYEENKALIFCIWQNLHHSKWILGKAASILGNWGINIEMVSQWTMERAIVFWIESENMEKAINLLHNWLILP